MLLPYVKSNVISWKCYVTLPSKSNKYTCRELRYTPAQSNDTAGSISLLSFIESKLTLNEYILTPAIIVSIF